MRATRGRLAGYLDDKGNYREGTNPDPTYGGAVLAPDLVTSKNYPPPAGYDAYGNWVGVTTDPFTGKVTTASSSQNVVIIAAAAGLALLVLSIGGKRR